RVLRSNRNEESVRGLPLAQREHDAGGAPGPWIYLIGDQNGTPEELVDGAGQVVGRLERTTFGAAVATPDSRVTTQFRFPGQYCDDETGLHFNRYRYYDPSTGRYLSPDPTDIAGGFNQYGYLPNPHRVVRSDGLDPRHDRGVGVGEHRNSGGRLRQLRVLWFDQRSGGLSVRPQEPGEGTLGAQVRSCLERLVLEGTSRERRGGRPQGAVTPMSQLPPHHAEARRRHRCRDHLQIRH